MFVATQIRRPQHHRGENAGDSFREQKLPCIYSHQAFQGSRCTEASLQRLIFKTTLPGRRQVCIYLYFRLKKIKGLKMVDNFFMVRKVRNSWTRNESLAFWPQVAIGWYSFSQVSRRPVLWGWVSSPLSTHVKWVLQRSFPLGFLKCHSSPYWADLPSS